MGIVLFYSPGISFENQVIIFSFPSYYFFETIIKIITLLMGFIYKEINKDYVSEKHERKKYYIKVTNGSNVFTLPIQSK